MCFGFYYLCRKFTNVKIMWGALELYLNIYLNLQIIKFIFNFYNSSPYSILTETFLCSTKIRFLQRTYNRRPHTWYKRWRYVNDTWTCRSRVSPPSPPDSSRAWTLKLRQTTRPSSKCREIISLVRNSGKFLSFTKNTFVDGLYTKVTLFIRLFCLFAVLKYHFENISHGQGTLSDS